MNPLKVTWFRKSARVRLFHAWLLVQLGLHRDAPSRFRIKMIKAADWLETTIELMAASSQAEGGLQNENDNTEENKIEAIRQAYTELQSKMASIRESGENIKGDIETIKSKFLALLERCGLKDVDIPLFDEPNSVRHNHQTLITSFGIMSKSSTPTTPQRSRHQSRRDPATYADMLIEQLLAQASAITDSDTSPPSNEEKDDAARSSSQTGILSNNNNDPTKLIPLQLQFTARESSVPSATDLPDSRVADDSHMPQSNLREEGNEEQMDDQQIIDIIDSCEENELNDLEPRLDEGVEPQPATHCYATTDSGVTGSEHSHTATTTGAFMSEICIEDTGTDCPTCQAPAMGSTPELQTSESSGSLDIAFASLFDRMDCPEPFDSLPSEQMHSASDFNIQQDPASPVLVQATYYNFPTRYSESYARELHILEQGCSNPSTPQALSLPTGSVENLSPAPLTPAQFHSPEVGTTKWDEHDEFIFHGPLVVCLPPKTEPRPPRRHELRNEQDINMDRSYKPHLGDKGFDSEHKFLQPPIPPRRPMTDSKIGSFMVKSESAEIGTLWLQTRVDKSCGPPTLFTSTSVPHTHTPAGHSDYRSDDNESDVPHQSADNTSWSYYDLPGSANVPNNASTNMTGKNDLFDTVRSVGARQSATPIEAQAAARSASKRRRGNNRAVLPTCEEPGERPFPTRSARQRLSFSPSSNLTIDQRQATFSASPLLAGSATPSLPSHRLRRKKRQSPAMRRLIQQKENGMLPRNSPSASPRKPFNDLNNVGTRDSFLLTTSSNSLTQSSETYAKSSDTSPDMPLPSREEDLLDRDACYCDFTVDRQKKIETISAKKQVTFPQPDLLDSHRTIESPSTPELLVRRVEGAESSPSSFVPQTPSSVNLSHRAGHVQKKDCSSRDVVSIQSNRSSLSKAVPNNCALSKRTSSVRTISGSKHSDVPRPSRPASRASSCASSSSRSSSRKQCSTHPIASSTMIMDSNSPDTGSVYTWSIDEDSSSCNLEKSYIRSTKKTKHAGKNVLHTPRPATTGGCDSSGKHLLANRKQATFEISAMVSAFDETLQRPALKSGRVIAGVSTDVTARVSASNSASFRSPAPRTRVSLSAKRILAAAPSFLKRFNLSRNSSSNSHLSDRSAGQSSSATMSSNQATTSSMFLNRAKGSLICSSSEYSEIPDSCQVSAHPTHSRHLSASEPALANYCFDDDDELSHSVVPSDTDETPELPSESSPLDDRPDIPGKSSSSSSSTCTAARCRPRVTNCQQDIVMEASDVEEGAVAAASSSNPPPAANQDLLDSILTDSPKSVDSSGIFAPYNSYNSPVESVGSHNGYSSTVSSSVTSSDNNYNRLAAPPQPLPATQSSTRSVGQGTSKISTPTAATFVGNAQSTTRNEEVHFKRPFDPIPHVNLTVQRRLTRNQGVSATTPDASPQRPMSVRSDPLANKSSVFAVPPGVVTGPPKIKDKKSLVRKLKAFSSHFHKKTEKIQTLANL